jgi:DHA2 family multidrug resistance protein-like MFS transporter
LLPLDLLRDGLFRLSILTSIVSFAAQMLAFVALPFYLQGVLGRSVVETGFLMTPWPLAVGVAAPIAGRLADRYPVGLLAGCGLAVLAVGLTLMATLPAQASNLDVAWRMAVCGLGFGFFQSPNNRAIVSSAPRSRSGAAGGMLATGRLLGQTSGAVVMAVLFHLAVGRPTATALAIAAAVAAVAACVSLLRLRAPSQA